jgi:hypothetical protein
MAWPGHNPRYFGQFYSRTEAEKWIDEHRWLAKQSKARSLDEKPPQTP